jgi:hypothetical protein
MNQLMTQLGRRTLAIIIKRPFPTSKIVVQQIPLSKIVVALFWLSL